jgi:hypothetical protein
MTIQELGAIGEFIGSIAVLATLVYLTIQVRASKIQTRASLLQHRSDAARQLWLTEVQTPLLAKAMIKASSELGSERTLVRRFRETTSLTDEEISAVLSFAAAHFIHRQTMFLSELTTTERKALDNQIRVMFRSGPFRLWFDFMHERRNESGFDFDFMNHVYEIVRE